MADADLMAALHDFAEVIRKGAMFLSGWSERIPESGRVEQVRDNEVLVIFGNNEAPHAYSYEVQGVRHPVFGTGPRSTWHWVLNDWRPFLAPAAEQYSDEALFEIAKVIDKWGNELGYKGD